MTETIQQAARRLSKPALDRGLRPVALHTYYDCDGNAIYWRIRAKDPTTGEKWVRPMHANGRGYELGEPKFSGGKPLYNLHHLAANPEIDLLVVEGENKVDALAKIGVLATTSGSASSAGAADWTPLQGRACVLWPDNDHPGRAYAGTVAAILEGMGCELSVIDVDALNLPEGGDVVDWLAANPDATAEDVFSLPCRAANHHGGTPRDQPQDDRATAGDDPDSDTWPDALDPAAMHGIAGEFVRLIGPVTEADPAAILTQFLVAFGYLVGRGPHYRVESTNHHANLFALLVGQSSKARKGTAFDRVRHPLELIDGWKPHVKGLSSGEGLKFAVRDAREETKTNKKGELVTEIIDSGVADKRLLVTEAEFASVLRAVQRQGSTLSATVREAWDSGDLRTLTKNDPITATGGHVSILGHITADELRAELTATDTANGFANRFLFVAVRRSKLLPFGGEELDEGELHALAARLQERAELARTRGRVAMTTDARRIWAAVYPELSEGGDGLHGSVTARAEAQTVRMALIYALLDGADQIDASHLAAALAVWTYCDATARHIFGASLGDRTADEIMRRLRLAGADGMTRNDIRDAFGRHMSSERIGAALELLRRRGKATVETVSTGGRPAEVWRATRAESAESAERSGR